MKTFPKICASVASNPSQLGVKMHNAGYYAKNLDYTYVAIGANEILEAINVLKDLNIRGMGVSMPFKQSVIDYLDEVDESVRVIGACNTVVNDEGHLKGYNTDWIGAQNAIMEKVDISKLHRAVIIGSGGVARAIAYALKVNGLKVYVSARNAIQRKEIVKDLNLDGETDLENQGKFDADIVINATPDSTSNGPVNLDKHLKATVVFDVAFNAYMTDLTRNAESRGLIYISGWRMLLLQGVKQFELYTCEKAPVEEMGNVILNWLKDLK